MNLNIRSGTAGYNNKILVSNGAVSLGRNDVVNAAVPKKSIYRTPIMHARVPRAAHTSASQAELMQEEERVILVLVLTSSFEIWYAL